MERSVAIKKLGQLLGKKLGYRVNAKAPTKEEREAAQAELTRSIPLRNKLKEQRDARHEQILAGDAEYQRLKAEYKAERDRLEELFGVTRHYKITVGTSEGMFFLHKAEGDSWEEVIAKLTAEKQPTHS